MFEHWISKRIPEKNRPVHMLRGTTSRASLCGLDSARSLMRLDFGHANMLSMSGERAGTRSEPVEEEIEVTPEMVEAGLSRLFRFHISEPDEDELRVAVAEVFKAMAQVLPARPLATSTRLRSDS